MYTRGTEKNHWPHGDSKTTNQLQSSSNADWLSNFLPQDSAVSMSLKAPPHLRCVTTLPRETFVTAAAQLSVPVCISVYLTQDSMTCGYIPTMMTRYRTMIDRLTGQQATNAAHNSSTSFSCSPLNYTHTHTDSSTSFSCSPLNYTHTHRLSKK